MNILDFLSNSNVCESKSDARRCIKANRISIDFKKITDEKTDIPVVLEEDDMMESVDAGTWLCRTPKTEAELVMFNLAKKSRTLNIKGQSEIVDMMLGDIFVVENGKKNFFIVTIKTNRFEISE